MNAAPVAAVSSATNTQIIIIIMIPAVFHALSLGWSLPQSASRCFGCSPRAEMSSLSLEIAGQQSIKLSPATASILLISSSKPSADEWTQLRLLGRCRLDGLVDVTVSVPLQSSPSVCGCAEAAWRFCPAAASDTFLGSGTRMNSQKATHSRTLSESVVLFQTYTPQFLKFRNSSFIMTQFLI